MLDALLGEVVDVGDPPTGNQRDLQVTQPIQRRRVGDGDRLEDAWRVDRASRASHERSHALALGLVLALLLC